MLQLKQPLTPKLPSLTKILSNIGLVINILWYDRNPVKWLIKTTKKIFWKISIDSTQRKKLKIQMKTATNYYQWQVAASTLDSLEGKEEWKNVMENKEYDYELVQSNLSQMISFKADGDYSSLMSLLEQSMSRHFANIDAGKLYLHCRVGTKSLIEEYLAEVVDALHMIAEAEETQVDITSKYEFFINIQKLFGRTALCLGGQTKAYLKHLGVLTTLNEHHLLPRVISGTSSGAICAAIVCTQTEEQLTTILEHEEFKDDFIEDLAQPKVFVTSIKNLLKHGYLFNGEHFQRSIVKYIGDITFLEAYERTRRILNIAIGPSNDEMPMVLNYKNAPNVIIWTAVYNSYSISFVLKSSPILEKDSLGDVVPWKSFGNKLSHNWFEKNIVMDQLSEMFNINHLIVSETNPSRSWSQYITKWISNVLYNQFKLLIQLGIFPNLFKCILSIANQKYQGDITSIPQSYSSNFSRLFSSPRTQAVKDYIHQSEQATWEQVSLIRSRCEIEITIDQILQDIRRNIRTQMAELSKQNAIYEIRTEFREHARLPPRRYRNHSFST